MHQADDQEPDQDQVREGPSQALPPGFSISQWPEEARPREKLLARGPDALSDAELLAIFLRTGVRGKTAVDLARDLIHSFGSLRNLINASQEEFCRAKGLGDAKFVQLRAVTEMTKRYLLQEVERSDALTSPEVVADLLKLKLREYPFEVFACLFLDNQHRFLKFEELFRGTVNSASVHPREVVRQAILTNAAAVIIAHNHPSGIPEPSQADLQITQRLREALALVDVRLLDHFIIGDGRPVSFAERGLL